MDHAGTTIEGVVHAVERVSTLVQQISSATKEQSQGIAQVNEAVTQLDTVTQQNPPRWWRSRPPPPRASRRARCRWAARWTCSGWGERRCNEPPRNTRTLTNSYS